MRSPSPPRRRSVPAVLAVLVALGLLAGCTGLNAPGRPPPTPAGPEPAARALVAALQHGDLRGLTLFDASAEQAQADYDAVTAGLGGVKPTVALGPVSGDDLMATAMLSYRWDFGDGAIWSYSDQVQLSYADGDWRVMWNRAVVQPSLGDHDRLSLRRSQATRGNLVGADQAVIMKPRAVRHIGIAKSAVPKNFAASAAKLAALLDIDAKDYVAKVKAGGPQQFVEAITYRADDPRVPSLATLRSIPGAQLVNGTQVLAPTRDFARAVVGTVGDATKELVDGSDGAIRAGDQTGLSGLQRRYDARLRGTAEFTIVQVRDPVATTASGPSGSGPTGSSSSVPPAPASPSASGTPSDVATLWSRPAKDGAALRISLDVSLQKLAEKTLSASGPAAALVAIDPKTGAVVAAANNAAAKGQALATFGQFAPGSTFKIISALALIRKGMKPTDQVSCTRSVTVDGYTFHNYSDYPPTRYGTITLADAVAYSCNTAFINLRSQVSAADLRDAAASLGMGTDYDVGFPAYFGAIPDDATATGHAAAMIGQGKVLASPMAMASVAASVAAGHTVVAHLVAGHEATFKGNKLAASEATQLRALMHGVVTRGTGARLAGIADGAKTGTAEYGTGKNIRTHAWMIAYTRDLAVAVFVSDGATGAGVAGPLLQRFLQGA